MNPEALLTLRVVPGVLCAVAYGAEGLVMTCSLNTSMRGARVGDPRRSAESEKHQTEDEDSNIDERDTLHDELRDPGESDVDAYADTQRVPTFSGVFSAPRS